MVAPSRKDFGYSLAGNRFGTLQHMVFITGKLSSGSDAGGGGNNTITPKKAINFSERVFDLMNYQINNLFDVIYYKQELQCMVSDELLCSVVM